MSEGGTYAGLRQRYTAALSAGENSLRALLGSSSSSWKLMQTVTPKAAIPKEDDAVLSKTEADIDTFSGLSNDALGPIAIHRRKSKGAPDIARAVCTVPLTDSVRALDSFRAILGTHSIRDRWDTVVEKQEVLEIVEPSIKLVRTFTKIGWPSSARDVVTVDKILQDPGKTLIHLSVSLPRSTSKGHDDPPFLQPSPPYVRSHMHICAFVLTCPTPTRAKLSMYWQWDLRGSGVVWANHINAMPSIVSSLVDYARQQAPRIPYVRSWGKGVTFEADDYDAMQDRLDLDYGIFIEEAIEEHDKNHVLLEKSKERRRLERSIEIHVPPIDGSGAGWNLTMPTSPEGSESTWAVYAERGKDGRDLASRLIVRITHKQPKEDFASVHISLQRLAGGKSFKLNGELLPILDVEERDPVAFTARAMDTMNHPDISKPVASVLGVENGLDAASHRSAITATTAASHGAEISLPVQKDLLAHIRRSYAHFLSLLQSPSAKWRNLKELRNVAISQYIAIDPTMTPIYKYEATFVNTTVWDLLSVLTNGGSRLFWDRHSGLERFQMLSELQIETTDGDLNPNEQSAGEGRASFWEARWKPLWPTAAREAVFVRTSYRSPTTVHLLQTSVPDDEGGIWRMLADKLSPLPDGAFRLQSPLQSVALDQISPTTTSIVLVDQTNPKSWTKSGYNAMANAVANIGEFALKEGAPPLLTHLSGAITIQNTYDHEQAGRYELRYARLATKHVKGLESVLRLDLDVWSPSGATLVIEPAPDRVSAVLRHRLSEKGSGCWITVEHNGEARAEAEHTSTISVTIEKSQNVAVPSARGPPIIMVNGESIKLEREELDDAEVQSRRMQKRIANRAIMLDRSPTPRATAHFGRPPSIAEAPISTPTATSRAPTPTAHKRVKSAANAADMNASSDLTSKLPIHYAFDALSILQQLHQENADARVDESDWTILSYAENNAPIRISKRNMPSLSLNLPLYRVERTLPGVSEEQLLRLIQSNSSNTRTTWDERLSSIENIAQYDNACSSSIWIARPSFPTRSRIAYMASVRAREEVANDGPAKQETSVTYVAASSVPLSAFDLDCSEGRAIVASERLNPSKLLETYVPLEGWVIETNAGVKDEEDDESETQTYTKCSFYTCSDIPLMVAGSFGQSALRARLARILDLLESLSKSTSAGLVARFPEPAYSIGNIYRMSPESWIVRPGQRCSSAVGFLGNSMTFKIRLPFPPSAPPLSSHDIESSSLAGGSGVSQRSLGLRSIGAEAHVEESAVGSLATRDEANDTVIAEIVFLRDLTVSGYEVRSSATLPAGLVLPTDTSFWTKLSPLPFKAQLYSESPSGKSDTSYILRISLPTGQYTAPMEHPLSALADSPSLPRWYRKLSTESGVVQFQATPVRNLSRADGRPMSTLKVTLDGLEVPYSTDYRKLLKTEEWPLDSLVGVSKNDVSNGPDPTALHPILVNTAFLKHPPSRHKDAMQSPGPASPPLVDDSPSTEITGDEKAQNSSSTKSPDTNKQPLVDLFTATTVIHHGNKEGAGTQTTTERTYRLAFVILIAVISFLLGSLLRSLLSPGDYIFFTRPLDSMEAGLWELLNPQKKWKYAMRLLQVPLPGSKRDFVAALVERD